MRVLALSHWTDLEASAGTYAQEPHQMLRAPKAGLIMLRGRMGGEGSAFNLGEATVTRCAVQTAAGPEGHAYVMGRNSDHAHLAALIDGLMQDESRAGEIAERVIAPLNQQLLERRNLAARKAAATRVDFFTLVRGEND